MIPSSYQGADARTIPVTMKSIALRAPYTEGMKSMMLSSGLQLVLGRQHGGDEQAVLVLRPGKPARRELRALPVRLVRLEISGSKHEICAGGSRLYLAAAHDPGNQGCSVGMARQVVTDRVRLLRVAVDIFRLEIRSRPFWRPRDAPSIWRWCRRARERWSRAQREGKYQDRGAQGPCRDDEPGAHGPLQDVVQQITDQLHVGYLFSRVVRMDRRPPRMAGKRGASTATARNMLPTITILPAWNEGPETIAYDVGKECEAVPDTRCVKESDHAGAQEESEKRPGRDDQETLQRELERDVRTGENREPASCRSRCSAR